MKTKFRDAYLVATSFIIGVMFIIQCGGSSASIAETVMDAFGIDYSNSESAIEATTVQGAIDELALRSPRVFDANGQEVGVYVGQDDAGAWEIWLTKSRAILIVDQKSGHPVDPYGSPNYEDGSQYYYPSSAYFVTEDCSGQAYLKGYKDYRVHQVGDKYYWFTDDVVPVTADALHSTLNDDTGCTGDHSNTSALKVHYNPETSYLPAKEIFVDSLTGPLGIR